MTRNKADELAAFVARATWDDLSPDAVDALKIHVLDSLGCAIGAQGAEPITSIREHLAEFGGRGLATLIGGGRTAPDRAAFWNSALVRYLDFNDGYLASGETCHPSDNLGAVLAASEYAGRSGKDLLLALAVAYQVQCRLSDVAPVRARGFDHVTQGVYALAAGLSKALALDAERAANAIGMCGAAFNALRVTRTGALSNWKGLAFANAAFGATHAAFLAKRGITGPREVFEGHKGFMDAIAGSFDIDWMKEDLERVRRTILKRYNAEIHAQAALEAVLDLRRAYAIVPGNVERVELDIFEVAYHIIGGGEEGDKRLVRTKEEADHSLPYMIAVALLDGEVMPRQYEAERIVRGDVQGLLQRVEVRPREDLTQRFPEEHACRVAVILKDGRRLEAEKWDYEGFHSRPMRWDTVRQKFDRLAEPCADTACRGRIAETVAHLENATVAELMDALGRAGGRRRRRPASPRQRPTPKEQTHEQTS